MELSLPEIDFGKLTDIGRWFDPVPSAEVTPLYYVLLGLFAVGAAGTAFARYYWLPRRFKSHRLLRELTRRVSEIWLGLWLLGLAFILSRLTGIPYLAMRIWLLLDVLALLGVAAFAAYYYFNRLPARLAAYAAAETKQRYMPRPKARRPHHRSRQQKKARRR